MWSKLRWLFFGKAFESYRAMLVGFYYYIVKRHETEICQRCGHPVYVVYWVDDQALWNSVMGHDGGVLCPRCFDDAVWSKNHGVRWIVVPFESPRTLEGTKLCE